MKKKWGLFLIAVFFISFLLLLNWNSFSAPFERDEGEYAYSAWLLRTGGTPYQESFLQKPPLIIYTYWIGQVISSGAVWPPRVLAVIFVFLTAVLVGLIATKEWGKLAGVFSAFLFLPLVSFPPLTPFAANTEKFMLLPLVGLVALFVYFRHSQKEGVYLGAGVLSALAILYKPICLLGVVFILLFWLYDLYRFNEDRNLSKIIKPFFLMGGGVFLTTVIVLIPFFKVWPSFFQEVFIFNLSYASSFGSPWGNLILYLGKFLYYWWILFFLFLGLWVRKPQNFFYYIALILIFLLTVFSSPIGHYYLILMPWLALMGGALFSSLLRLVKNQHKKLVSVVILFVILFSLLFPFRKQFFLNPRELSEWVYGTVNPFGESQEVANHLARITTKDDWVFVAGSEPQIYYYAQRKSPTRFVITYPLNLPTSYQEQYQTELVSNLERNSPKAIVLSQRVHSGLWNEGSPQIFIKYFEELIASDYKIIGGYVWKDGRGYWQEPLDEGWFQQASLLLLIKK